VPYVEEHCDGEDAYTDELDVFIDLERSTESDN
jgi:hypothetical protein